MRKLEVLLALLLAFVAGTASTQVGTNRDVLNPNLATADELASLDPINEALAQKIIDARPIASNLELDALIGVALNDEQKKQIYVGLFLPINLNTASSAEIALVPGINRRMVHEFEEYRPYTSLDQFRAEIGKYVDDEEVARYEQYIFVPMNLNSASSEAFATIPGMSQRMVHEFEEYRPYRSIDQFRAEIGKYVDEGEVARLERYVVIE